jgi:hypothetical protein
MAKKKARIIRDMWGEMGYKSFQCPKKNPEVDNSVVEEDQRSNFQIHPRPAFYPRRQEGGPADGQGHAQGPRRATRQYLVSH